VKYVSFFLISYNLKVIDTANLRIEFC